MGEAGDPIKRERTFPFAVRLAPSLLDTLLGKSDIQLMAELYFIFAQAEHFGLMFHMIYIPSTD